jgi:hypothetical protein
VEEVFEAPNAATRKFWPTPSNICIFQYWCILYIHIKDRSNTDPIKIISLESDME